MSSRHGESRERGNALVQFYRWVFGLGHERNVGGIERSIRYTLGGLCLIATGALLVFPFRSGISNSVLAVVLAITGLSLVYEAQVQYCPLNQTIGRSTYEK
jgi:hypothetical protein